MWFSHPERKSDVNIRSSLTGSETSSLFDQITGNNLAVGDLTDQVYKMRQSLSVQVRRFVCLAHGRLKAMATVCAYQYNSSTHVCSECEDH